MASIRLNTPSQRLPSSIGLPFRAFVYLNVVQMNDGVRHMCREMDAWRCCLHPSRLAACVKRHMHASLVLRRASRRFVHKFVLSFHLIPTRSRNHTETSPANAFVATCILSLMVLMVSDGSSIFPPMDRARIAHTAIFRRSMASVWRAGWNGGGNSETSFGTVISCSCAAMHVV